MLRSCLALLLSVHALSCGSTSNGSPTGTATESDAGLVEDSSPDPADSRQGNASDAVALADAPATCGTKVGDILCDLPYEGYVRDGVATGLATSVPYEAAKLSEIVARGTQKYAFIWTSAHW